MKLSCTSVMAYRENVGVDKGTYMVIKIFFLKRLLCTRISNIYINKMISIRGNFKSQEFLNNLKSQELLKIVKKLNRSNFYFFM